jgi:hypothetical protein
MIGLVVIVLAVLGVKSLLNHSGNTPSKSGGATSTDASKVCTDNARLQADAYAAGTKQPIALYARSGSVDGNHYQGVYVLGTAPSGSSLRDAYVAVGTNLTSTRSNSQTPVLVACITRSHETLTEQVCKYSDGKNVPVYNATYHLTVYEARSRNVVKEVDIDTLPSYTCTSFVAYDGKGFYHSWNPAAVALALYPLVQ